MSEQLFEDNTGGVGFTFTNPASNLEYWLDCWQGEHPLLDIGCGHGTNTLLALARGAHVIATDIAPPPLEPHPKLQCMTVKLPKNMPLENNSVSGVLCAEVFHFLKNNEVKPAIKEIHRILQPEGKLVITCASSQLEVLKPTGINEQIIAARNKEPDAFHGYNDYIALLEESAIFFNKPEITNPSLEAHRRNIPDCYLNLFIAEQLSEAFEKAGFRIIQSEYGPAPHYPLWLHGEKDMVKIVASKTPGKTDD